MKQQASDLPGALIYEPLRAAKLKLKKGLLMLLSSKDIRHEPALLKRK